VNVRCLDRSAIEAIVTTQFDDANREAATAAIAHLAADDNR
jgi:hypothetical protein